MRRQETEHPHPDPSGWEMSAEILGLPYRGKPGPRQPHNRFNWECGILEYVVFIEDPTPEEVQGFQQIPAQLGFHHDPPVIWAVLNIPGIHLADAPFTPHLVDPSARYFPTLHTADTRYPVTVIMADARDGAVRAIRCATISPAASQRLLEATLALLSTPFDTAAYERAIQETYARCPGPQDLLHLCQTLDELGS